MKLITETEITSFLNDFAIDVFLKENPFSKDMSEEIKLIEEELDRAYKYGQFEGKLYSGTDFEKISNLPSMDQLRAEFVGLLEAPMAHTISTLEAVLSSIVTCLENKAKKDAAG